MVKLFKGTLPVPKTKYNCWDLIGSAEEVLEILDGEDTSGLDLDGFEYEAVEIVDALSPIHIEKDSYSYDWKKDVLIWIFMSKAIGVVRRYDIDSNYRTKLKDLCKEYIEFLEEKKKEFQTEEE